MKLLNTLTLIASLSLCLSALSLEAQDHFLGTGSCSSSNCHGGSAPRSASNVLQNEYVTWSKHDAHSRAWRVLTEADAKRIAFHLGIKEPEHDEQCLVCHSTYVPKQEQHGDKYVLEDGVSCESCHGAAERWIKSHASSGADRRESIANGMKDLFPLAKRAELCADCHFGGTFEGRANQGSTNQQVTHKLIGAGHPRLSFELDTFSMLQPRHWEVDKDYIARKGSYNATAAWLTGQAVLALRSAARLELPSTNRAVMPEFSNFYCFTCHHSLTADQWKVRDYHGKPGELRPNLANLNALTVGLKIVNPALAGKLGTELSTLEQSYIQNGAPEALASLKQILSEATVTEFGSLNPPSDQLNKLLKQLLTESTERNHLQYEEAEQLVMAIASVLSTFSAPPSTLKSQLDQLYVALRNPEEFVADEFTVAAQQFLRAL